MVIQEALDVREDLGITLVRIMSNRGELGGVLLLDGRRLRMEDKRDREQALNLLDKDRQVLHSTNLDPFDLARG